MKRAFLILLIITCLFCEVAEAQYYNTGQDPASLRWEQIKTSNFRIVYPRNFSDMAQRYARLLEESYMKVSALYPQGKVKVPVIIHNYSLESNGYVSWAPRRMELYPFPGHDNMPMDPAEQLSIHETTHVLQIASLNHGLSKALSVLFGEQAFSLGAILIPDWALEGDAVYAETAFTASGRGRSNAFLQEARAMALDPGGKYSFDKLVLGSYRNFTPNHYVFGYLMMNQLRGGYPGVWSKTIYRTGRNLSKMNRGIKKNAGISEDILYSDAFDKAMERWKSFLTNSSTHYPVLDITFENDYINHYSPHRIDSSRVLSLKTSLKAPSAFVITDTGKGSEQVLATTGYIYPYFYSYSDGTIVWSELTPHPRWDNLDYSVIKKMSLADGIVKQLTFRTRFTAPDLSPDGRTIVAVSITPELHYHLAFINAFNGRLITDIEVPDQLAIQRPEWSSDGKVVTVVSLNEAGEGIRTFYPDNKTWETEITESETDIIEAKMIGDTVFFLAQGGGSDNIYRLTPENEITRVTESRFGISGFSVSDDELLFSDYSSDGFNISSAGISCIIKESEETVMPFPDIAPLPSSETISNNTVSKSFIAQPYRKISHLFNFHSWFPFYANMNELLTGYTTLRPGVTLLSQNHLSTLTSTIGYEYSNKNHYFHSSVKWQGWYPVIEASITYGGKQTFSKPQSVTEVPADISAGMNFNLYIYQPLYFSYGKFRQLVMPAIYTNYQNSYTYLSASQGYDEGLIHLTGRFYFSNIFRYAYRDIYPRWGQVLDIRVTSAPWDKDISGTQKYISGMLFLPGIIRNHSLVMKAGFEDQTPFSKHNYYNLNPYPRGLYDDVISEKMYSFSVDYTMPLFYPDLSAGRFFYLKRVRGSLFYDKAIAENARYYNWIQYPTGKFSSSGGEILFDFYLFRFPFEISTGVSGGYFLTENRWFISPVMSVNVYGNTLGRNH